MAKQRPTIFLSAAETSGDDRAAGLIRALKRRLGDARFIGAAGPKMAEAGCEVVMDLTGKASMLLGPVGNIFYYWKAVRKLQRAIADLKPDVHVPVDSPALNWHLAKSARRAGAGVMYYIAPQVWAWAPWRIKKLRRLCDHVACILPFEQEYFRRRGVEATYVGHPLFDELPPQRAGGDIDDLIEAWLDGKWRVALLPGSRAGEIKQHIPALAGVAGEIKKRWPGAKCTVTAVNDAAAGLIRDAWPRGYDMQDIVVARTGEVLARSQFAVAVSGTVTLQAAHFGVPMVILYKAGRLRYHLLGRWLIRTKWFSLVNILAGRRIVPELIPWHGSGGQVIEAVMDVMGDLGCLADTRRKLLELTAPLAAPPPQTAADRTADIIVDMLSKRD